MTEASYALRQLLTDAVETTALRAAGALGRLGEKTGLPLITQILRGDGPHARLAAQALGDIVGHRFPANAQGIQSARRYLAVKGPTLMAS